MKSSSVHRRDVSDVHLGRRRRFALTIVGCILQSAALAHGEEVKKLGQLSFTTSGAAAAQPDFLVGVKLLHNFEYEEAQASFLRCQQTDPEFAMAYWGEAMCYNHPLWNEQELEAGREVLQRLDANQTGPKTERERDFLRAVRTLYGEGDKPRRDERYLSVLESMAQRYPDDHEVACFHALALLGTCAGKRDVPVYMKAAAILEDVYQVNPAHPGVLHYLIHCYDDPTHAPLGLRAARTYGSIAENSAHAKHMPSHIFLPLGMWDEVVRSNAAAWEAGQARLVRLKRPPTDFDIHAMHALQWLHYGRLQVGDYEGARVLLSTMAELHQRRPSAMVTWYFALMRSTHVVNSPDWDTIDFPIDVTEIELSAAASHHYGNGLAAIRRGTTGAERALQQIRDRRSAAELEVEAHSQHHSSYFDGVYASSIRTARIVETQLEALIRLADGEIEASVKRLKDAVAAEERVGAGYGPPVPVQPTHELLGFVLLNAQRPREAQEVFATALKRTPGRAGSLQGLAAAAEKNGDDKATDAARAELRKNLGDNAPYNGWQDLTRPEPLSPAP